MNQFVSALCFTTSCLLVAGCSKSSPTGSAIAPKGVALIEEQNKSAAALNKILEEQKKTTAALNKILEEQKKTATAFQDLKRANKQAALNQNLEEQKWKAEEQQKRKVEEQQKRVAALEEPRAKATALAFSLVNVGEEQQASGDLVGALNTYRQSLEIRKTLAEADKGNVSVQYNLFVCQSKIGYVETLRFKYAEAKVWYENARDTLDPFRKTKQLTTEQTKWRSRTELNIRFCEAADKAIADLDFAVQQPAAIVSRLLNARVKYWHAKGRYAEVAATADKFRYLADLPDRTAGVNQYNAACGYALASDCPAADVETKQAYQAKAVEVLKESLDKGYFKAKAYVDHAKKDADLNPLRERDDFKMLINLVEKDAK